MFRALFSACVLASFVSGEELYRSGFGIIDITLNSPTCTTWAAKTIPFEQHFAALVLSLMRCVTT